MTLNVVEYEFWYFVLFKFNICTLEFTWVASILTNRFLNLFWVAEKRVEKHWLRSSLVGPILDPL